MSYITSEVFTNPPSVSNPGVHDSSTRVLSEDGRWEGGFS